MPWIIFSLVLASSRTATESVPWRTYKSRQKTRDGRTAGQLVFEDFLRTEYSEENLLFWLACEEYKNMSSATERVGAAKKICKEFVQVDAPRQINIDCVTREEIQGNLSQPAPNCFDRAQRLIYSLMENDCYPRFLKSEIYQTLLEQAEGR